MDRGVVGGDVVAKGFLSRKTNHGGVKAKPVFMYGCRFRSQLEARWAMVFTDVGVRWEYEPQVFRTEEGGYLPDFRIGVQKPWWLEIKGPEPIERDYVRAAHVIGQTGQKFRFLVGDLPGAGTGGYLQTRIMVASKWHPAEWKTPWSAVRLDAALLKAKAFRFNSSLLD